MKLLIKGKSAFILLFFFHWSYIFSHFTHFLFMSLEFFIHTCVKTQGQFKASLVSRYQKKTHTKEHIT